MKLWRPRFSVRTLVILVTLVCAYFAAWEATKRHAKYVNGERLYAETETNVVQVTEARPVVPLVFLQRELVLLKVKTGPYKDLGVTGGAYFTRYYLWLFGPTIKLPFESELQE